MRRQESSSEKADGAGSVCWRPAVLSLNHTEARYNGAGVRMVRKDVLRLIGSTALLLGVLALGCGGRLESGEETVQVMLPAARIAGVVSLEEAIAARRSVRVYEEASLTLEDVAQLLWAAQGITAEWGGRAAPSAGATYPLEVYVIAGEVEGLQSGVYRYLPDSHSATLVKEGDLRAALSSAALGQEWVRTAPASLVIAAAYGRTTGQYGERGERYVHMEVGHVGQNVYLQAAALALGTVMVGAFDDAEVKELLETDEEPLAIMPVGRPAG